MVILLKHTLKNIFSKPLRSLVLLLCMSVTCFTAYMMLDMSGALEGIIINYAADMLGSCDVQVSSSRHIPEEAFDTFPENVLLAIYGSTYKIATRDPEQYSYEFLKDMSIRGVDLDKAYQMGIFEEPMELADAEVGISQSYARDFGKKVGDQVDLYDEKGGRHEFTVKYILQESGVFIQKGQYTAVVNLNAMKVITARKELKSSGYLIDVVDDGQINAFCQELKEKYPTYQYSQIKGNEQIQEAISQITLVFVVLFTITFLMVIFVTVGLSERIICERMSVIGTFRSLGISNQMTTLILLLENIAYGLFGALFGTILYGLIREPMIGAMTMLEGDAAVRFDPIQPWIYLVVFVGAVLIQCVFPVFELAKVVKTAIRDIIFSNKDTEYRISLKRTVLGGCFLAAGAVLSAVFLKTNGILVILGMVLIVVALSLLMPLVMKGASELLIRVFEKLRMPVAALAAREIATKKTTVANGVLCVTVSSLAVAIFALAGGMMDQLSAQSYDADVLVIGTNSKPEYYSFVKDLPGVTKVEYLYSVLEELDLPGDTSSKAINAYDVMALPQGELFVAYEDLPDQIGKDEFALSDVQAEKLGLSVGDTLEIVFKKSYLFPITKTLRLTAVVNTSKYESIPVILLSRELFIDIYHDRFSCILVKCENPDEVKEKIQKYSLDTAAQFYTREEMEKQSESENAGMMMILYGIIVLGVVLTLIGISGNQAIGFEGRRREYAVMHSTAMSKGQIRKLIFLETTLSMGVGVVIAVFMGQLINFLLGKAVYAIGLPLAISGRWTDSLRMGAILMAVLLITCITPLRALRKMNTAQELKYE